MSIQELLQTLGERLRSSASVKTVYGDPIITERRTIVPVAKVAYGFGGGTGIQKGEEEKGSEGGGGGGGVKVKPVGVVEITDERTRFISFGEKRKLAAALFVGFVLGILIGKKRKKGQARMERNWEEWVRKLAMKK